MTNVNNDRTEARRRLSAALDSVSDRLSTSLVSDDISSLADPARSPRLPNDPFPGSAEPARLTDDEGFSELLSLVRDLVEAFREYVAASERSERRQWVLNVVSAAVAALSLAVSCISLLGQFGVIG